MVLRIKRKSRKGDAKYKTLYNENPIIVDVNEVSNKLNQMGYRHNFVTDDVVFIGSKCDNWRAEVKYNYITLYHESQRGKDKGCYHVQNHYKDFDFMIKSISEHDKFKLGGI